jgi:hypothetical protein
VGSSGDRGIGFDSSLASGRTECSVVVVPSLFYFTATVISEYTYRIPQLYLIEAAIQHRLVTLRVFLLSDCQRPYTIGKRLLGRRRLRHQQLTEYQEVDFN